MTPKTIKLNEFKINPNFKNNISKTKEPTAGNLVWEARGFQKGCSLAQKEDLKFLEHLHEERYREDCNNPYIVKENITGWLKLKIRERIAKLKNHSSHSKAKCLNDVNSRKGCSLGFQKNGCKLPYPCEECSEFKSKEN